MNTVLIVAPFVLLIVGIPVYLILFTTSLIALLVAPGSMTEIIQTATFGGLDSFPLLAVPFFIFAGEVMGQGGIAKRLVTWVVALIGGVRGSLALTTIASSELFGAMSGSSVGCVAAVGRLLYPALQKEGYSKPFAVSLIASSGAIAVIIPPSIPLIIYGATAQQPITTLFIAGLIPAALVGLFAATYVVIRSASKPREAVSAAIKFKSAWSATKDALWALGVPVVVFGGIYGGIFTPTEAAGVAAIYAILISVFIYRDISFRDIWKIAQSSTELIAQIMIIVAGAGLYSWFLTTSGMPQTLVSSIEALHLGATATLLLFNCLLLIVGSFLEPPAAILILTPLFTPVITALGVDPIHFGIIIAVNLSIGMYTPPFGLNLFASQSLFDVPLAQIYRGVLPFLAINVVALLLITYVPALSLLLVKH